MPHSADIETTFVRAFDARLRARLDSRPYRLPQHWEMRWRFRASRTALRIWQMQQHGETSGVRARGALWSLDNALIALGFTGWSDVYGDVYQPAVRVARLADPSSVASRIMEA